MWTSDSFDDFETQIQSDELYNPYDDMDRWQTTDEADYYAQWIPVDEDLPDWAE